MGSPRILAARMDLLVAALIAALLIVGILLADAGGREAQSSRPPATWRLTPPTPTA